MKKQINITTLWSMFLRGKTFLLVFLLTLTTGSLLAQTRSGAINLTGSEGRYINAYNSSGAHPLAETAFTIEMWTKILSDGNGNNDMCFWNMKSDDNRVSLVYINDTKFKLVVDGSATNGDGDIDGWSWTFNGFSSSTVFLNNWVHISFVYDGGNNVKLYINGAWVFSKNLYKNVIDSDHKIIKLMPQEGNGGYLQIGGQDKDGKKGLGYIADIRIWDRALTTSTISTYYNEEINDHHPYWSDLIRYYTGSDEYINSSGVIFIEDEKNNYDAVRSNTSVRVGGYYPPIHPPRLSGANVNFVADNCQTAKIDVNWYDYRNDADYQNEDYPGYALKRQIGNGSFTTLRENSTDDYDDTEINAGDKITYRLYSYWSINGTKYYSNDYAQTTGSWSEVYAKPTGIAATIDNCDATITLDWSSTVTPPKWYMQRANNLAFSSGVTTVSSNISGSATGYTNTPPNIETNYYYRLKAYGTDGNGCSVSSTYSDIVQGFSSNLPSAPTSTTLTPNSQTGEIVITWTEPGNNNADSWILKRTLEDGTDEAITTGITTFSYTDATIESCVVYNYSVGAVNECTVGEYFEIKNASVSYSELDDKITGLTASKGYFGDGVQLEWGINGTSTIIQTYVLERSLSGDNVYSTIATFDADLLH